MNNHHSKNKNAQVKDKNTKHQKKKYKKFKI